MSLKWGPSYHVELPERFESWLQDLRERHPQYSEEEILFAALACGLDWLHRDEKSVLTLKSFYPPETTAERFSMVAVRLLAGKICTYTPRRKPRMYTGRAWNDQEQWGC